MGRSCQYIVDWHTEPGEDGDPIFCDVPASIKWDGCWYCADHYDTLVAAGNGDVVRIAERKASEDGND